MKISFNSDGSEGIATAAQRAQMQRHFIGWARRHTDYLPGTSPEELLWATMQQDDLSLAVDQADAKEKFVTLTHRERGLSANETVDSKMILETQIRRLAHLDRSCKQMNELCTILEGFLSGALPK